VLYNCVLCVYALYESEKRGEYVNARYKSEEGNKKEATILNDPSQKVRFALVGCGRIARKHTEALHAIAGAEVVAVCDSNIDRAKTFGDKLGIPFYSNYHDMLTKHDVDVVSILTPSGLHAKHILEIVKHYRKHIVCEKPLTLRLSDADEVIRVCKEMNVKLFVVLQNRFNLPVQQLKLALDQGKFGKLVLGTVRVRWTRTQQYYDSDEWRGTWELDGGCLANQACHHIDLLLWLMGEPTEVSAKIATRLVQIDVEDTGVAILKFANGALGVIEATTAARPVDLEGSISILGENGTVEIAGFAVNEIKTWLFSNDSTNGTHTMRIYNENPQDVYGFGHKRYLEHVVDCIKNDTPILVDGSEGRKSVELLHAIYEAAETGKSVTFPFVPSNPKLGGRDE
jgi:UDP-N-acetyl-2-amino-2-deoxyglucuronate dehydrogenase